MSCLTTALQNCENLQDELNLYFPTCAAAQFKEPMPFAEWITSPTNRTGLSQVIAPGEGKVRTINLRYRKRFLESEVKANQAYTCTATTQMGDCLKDYTIDTTQNAQVEKYIPLGFLNESCRRNANFFMETLSMMIDVLDRKVATNLSTHAAAAYGEWATDVVDVNGSNPDATSEELVVKTLVDATTKKEPWPDTMQMIDTATMQTGYCGPYAIFSGTKLYEYYRTLSTGCCNLSGIDLRAQFDQYGKAVMYDRRIMAALGTLANQDKALLVMNGALQVLQWVQNDWKDNLDSIFKQGDNYFATVIVSPRLNLMYDLNIKDDCGNMSIILTATNKLVAMPADMFPATDIYEGVNFVNKIKVTNV